MSDFEFDLDGAEIQAGCYPVRINNALLHVNEQKGSMSMRLDLEVIDGNYKGEKIPHWIWLDTTHRMSIKSVKEFISAVTGQPVEGRIKLETDQDSEGKTIFPDFIGEELYAYVKPDGDFTKVTAFTSEAPSDPDNPF